MKKGILTAPSILSADFTRLKEEIKKIEDSRADMIHIDVMDGHFVPNITIGPLVVEAIRRCTKLPLDVHLMIESPHRFIKDFVDAGSDIITIHAEAYQKSSPKDQRQEVLEKGMSKNVQEIDEERIKEVLAKIKSLGRKRGLSLNPDSPFCIENVLSCVDMVLLMSVHPGFGGQHFIEGILPKIKEARSLYSGDIEVDGGITDQNAGRIISSGANIIVAGSYFFSAKDPKEAIKRLRG
jgi:ribulose-phosphate 3-epimerase